MPCPRLFVAASAMLLLLACGGDDQTDDDGSGQGGDGPPLSSSGGAGGAAASTGDVASSATTSGAGGGATGSGGSGGSTPPPQVIFVNFDGATIGDCSNYCSDAPNDQSWAISAHFGETEVTFAPYDDDDGKAVIAANLVSTFAPYNVAVTTTRPNAGPYTMVVVSPTPGPNHGVAPLDCGNVNPNDIAFVYNLYSSPKWSAPQQISQSAAHELGHSFGLEHVVGADDFMQWASSGNAFTVSTYDYAHPSGHDCIVDDVQDAPAMLLEALGPAP